MPKQILIVEDESIIAYALAVNLKNEGFDICGIAEDAKEALSILKKSSPDIALVDVSLAGELDGIELGRILKDDYNIPLLYLTSYTDDETLDRIKSLGAEGYMNKPYSYPALSTNINLILNKIQAQKDILVSDNRSDNFFIKANKGFQKLEIDDILYAQADDTFTQLCMLNGKHMISHTLKVVSQKLPASIFIRVHRSYLVNINKIERIMDDHVIIDNTPIPVSRQSKSELMRKISLL